MKKKDVMFITALVNGVLLCFLFVIGLTTKETKIELAQKLDKSKPAMLQVQPIVPENLDTNTLAQTPRDKIVYQLPKSTEDKSQVKVVSEKAIVAKSSLPAPVKIEKKEDIAQVLPEEKVVEVVVIKNDTLEALSRKHNSTVEKIIAFNDLKSPLLKIGQMLNIPQSLEVIKKKIETVSKQEILEHYTVKIGDNPWTIAMKHHMKVSALLKLNNLDDKSARKIKPGDKLRVR